MLSFDHIHHYPQLFPDSYPSLPNHFCVLCVVVYRTCLILNTNCVVHMLLVVRLCTGRGGSTRGHNLLEN